MRYEHIAVYILASKARGTLYIGVTENLIRRIFQHRARIMESFAGRYGVTQLVYYEMHHTMDAAIHREKRLKKYIRGRRKLN